MSDTVLPSPSGLPQTAMPAVPTRWGVDAPPLTLRGLCLEALAAWRWLVGAGAVGFLLAFVALHWVEPRFTAEMTVGPTSRSGQAAMGPRLPGGGGGARALAEPGAGDELLSDFARYTELLTAVLTAERLAARPDTMTTIFSAAWDAETEQWRPPPRPGPWLRRQLLRLLGRTPWSPPDSVQLAEHLRRELTVDSVGDGPIRRIAYRHPDREFALAVVAGVHAAADGLIRHEAARRTLAEIAYVRDRLAAETMADHRRSLATLLAEQERVRMMIDLDLPFAADTIEPPTASALPDWPNPLVVLPAGALTGLMVGLLFVYARAVWTLPVP